MLSDDFLVVIAAAVLVEPPSKLPNHAGHDVLKHPTQKS